MQPSDAAGARSGNGRVADWHMTTALVASILSGGSRGQRKVTGHATPFGVPSRQRHRGVKGRCNRGAWCLCARVVTGEATTAVVTHAQGVGSRVAEALGGFRGLTPHGQDVSPGYQTAFPQDTPSATTLVESLQKHAVTHKLAHDDPGIQ